MNNIILKEKQLLVKVFYSGVNRADISQSIGSYLPPKDHCQDLGLEIMGQVVKLGEHVSQFKLNDFVFGLVNGGGYNEYCIMEEGLAILKPQELDYIVCASMPETFMTALYNLLFIKKLESGSVVLIHAGASGVGLAVVQVAKLLGFKVIATTRSSYKEQICKNYGADLTINTKENINFIEVIKNQFDTIELIIDPVLGSFANIDLELLTTHGTLICLGLLGGSKAEIDCSLVLRKNLTIIGSTLRNQSNDIKKNLADLLKELIIPNVLSKRINVLVDKVFSINDKIIALDYLKSNANIGKVLLKHNF